MKRNHRGRKTCLFTNRKLPGGRGRECGKAMGGVAESIFKQEGAEWWRAGTEGCWRWRVPAEVQVRKWAEGRVKEGGVVEGTFVALP